MKKIIYSFILFTVCGNLFSQAPFWTETFGTGCDQGTVAAGFNSGQGVWTTSLTGPNDAEPNKWYISATEAGMGVGNCGDGCLGNGTNNRTLHIGYDFNFIGFQFTDDGSVYMAGSGYYSDIRAQSPVINCSGQSNISLSFNYFLGGVSGSDYFNVQYSPDAGATWSTISTPAATPLGTCSPQGLWATYSIALPASANNNANVKVGFRWQNTDASGNDPSVAIDDISLTTNTFSPTFTLTNPICSGNSTTVTANTGTYVVTGYTWTASPAGPIFATPNASSTSISFTTQNTYSITITAISGGTTASQTKTILVNPTPVISTSATPATACLGQSVTISASGATNYTWNPGAITGSSTVVSPTSTTIYTVTGSNGTCNATANRTVTINNPFTLTLTANPSTITSGASSTLNANGATNYTWNPGALSGSNVAVSPTVTTQYTVNATSGACTGTGVVTVTVILSSGISNINIDSEKFVVFPNPAKDQLNIQSVGSSITNAEILIIDALGKVIIKQKHNFSTESSTFTVNLQNISEGVYYIKINSSDDIKVQRFIKE